MNFFSRNAGWFWRDAAMGALVGFFIALGVALKDRESVGLLASFNIGRYFAAATVVGLLFAMIQSARRK